MHQGVGVEGQTIAANLSPLAMTISPKPTLRSLNCMLLFQFTVLVVDDVGNIAHHPERRHQCAERKPYITLLPWFFKETRKETLEQGSETHDPRRYIRKRPSLPLSYTESRTTRQF